MCSRGLLAFCMLSSFFSFDEKGKKNRPICAERNRHVRPIWHTDPFLIFLAPLCANLLFRFLWDPSKITVADVIFHAVTSKPIGPDPVTVLDYGRSTIFSTLRYGTLASVVYNSSFVIIITRAKR